MNKFKLSELNQLVYEIVGKLNEDFVECLKDLIIDNRNVLMLRSKIFREVGLDYKEYAPNHKYIVEIMVLNVLLRKFGGKQMPLSRTHKDMIISDQVSAKVSLPKPKRNDSALDSMFDIQPNNLPDMKEELSPTGRSKSHTKEQEYYMLAYGASAKCLSNTLEINIDKAREIQEEFNQMYGIPRPSKVYGKPMTSMLDVDFPELENRVAANLSVGYEIETNPCGEIFFTEPKTCSLVGLKADLLFIDDLIKEKPMNLTLTRPVMVGNTDILTASKNTLDALIREAQQQIKFGSDLQELSQHHRNAKAELEDVIKLCVEQLDKDSKKDNAKD